MDEVVAILHQDMHLFIMALMRRIVAKRQSWYDFERVGIVQGPVKPPRRCLVHHLLRVQRSVRWQVNFWPNLGLICHGATVCLRKAGVVTSPCLLILLG